MISPKVRLLTNSPTPHNTPRVATAQRHRQEQPKISSGCCTPPRILGLWGCPPSMCQWATCAHLPAELSALERGVRKVLGDLGFFSMWLIHLLQVTFKSLGGEREDEETSSASSALGDAPPLGSVLRPHLWGRGGWRLRPQEAVLPRLQPLWWSLQELLQLTLAKVGLIFATSGAMFGFGLSADSYAPKENIHHSLVCLTPK